MARKTVDKEAVEKVRDEIRRLKRRADAISASDRASGNLIMAEYFSGRCEGFEMADNLLRALLDGRDVTAVYGERGSA